MSPEAFSAWFAGIAILVSLAAAVFAAKAAKSAKAQATVSDLEFRSQAPRLEADFSIDRWYVVNAGHSTAYNVQIRCQPHPCRVEMRHQGTLAEGKKAWAFPGNYAASHSICLSWTRTPEGGQSDKPVEAVFHEPSSD